MWAVVNYHVGICDGSIGRYVADFFVVEYDEGIRTLCSCFFIPLCESSPFFSKRRCPYRLGGGICGKFLVLCYRFTAYGVDDDGTGWCSVTISVCFYFKHVFGLAFSHLFICVEIICEQVECLLRDETWGLDGYWSVSSW